MPQISKYRLGRTFQEEIFRRFWSIVAHLKTNRDVAEFFSDILTHTEEVMLAKRLTIAVLLLRGKLPVDIANILHVSFSTIGRVNSWVDRAKPATKRELERVIDDAEWQAFFDTIEALFDKLPPRYGTDWDQAGKEKSQRAKDRFLRERLQ